ncbi:hypothetical protein QR680_002161 [Steinernema hermaphroditum]|nr:hypothetical protein QR680_002161 [Steinernema hermaphroditum]
MQGMVQQHHIQGGQPRTMHPPQLPTSSAHPTPSSSALRQALGYPTPPVVSSSLSQPNIPQQPQNAQVSVTHPGGSSSGNSNQFFGEQTRNAGNHLENEPQASSSNAGEYRSVGEVVHVNPKLVNEPILSREALDRVVKSVDPHETLEDDVAEAICVMMDEFINDVIGQASRVARHRGGTRLEGRDVSYALEHFFDMPMSADDFYSGSQPASARNRSVTNDAHQQRMALIKKTLKKP